MGSEQRRQAIESGKIVENAAAVRRRRRQEAAIMREELAIEMFAKGAKSTEISAALFERYEVKLTSSVPELIRRGLYRRVKENAPNVDIARELLLAQYRALLEVYMPRALGQLDDPNSPGRKLPPDTRAADLALKVLDKAGVASGAVAPPRSGDINLNIGLGGAPLDADAARRVALEQLARDRAKLREIDGQLADTPAVDGSADIEDGKIAPPFDLPPTPS